MAGVISVIAKDLTIYVEAGEFGIIQAFGAQQVEKNRFYKI